MALGYLDDSKLYAIASAIRAKTGDSATMTVDDMPDEIGSISTGAQVEPLSVTENGTYSAPTGYAYSPVTVNVSGGGGITADDIAMRTISGVVAGSATSMASYAFQSCIGITAARFPNVTSVSNSAFAYCLNMTTAEFQSATTIAANAFYACSKLSTVSIPSVSSLAGNAFYDCRSLKSVDLPNCSVVGAAAF